MDREALKPNTFVVTKDDAAWEVEMDGDGVTMDLVREVRDEIVAGLERGEVVLVIALPCGARIKINKRL